jgi:hypothetical protein
MKTGKSLSDLAREIERRAEAKQDFIAPAKQMRAITAQGSPILELAETARFPITSHAHGQLASYLEIPKRYYDRMLTDAPDLLCSSINRWLDEHAAERRMIRVLDDQVRAVLSDKYRPLENEDLAQAVLPVLSDLDVMILSADITDRRFYIKAVDRRIEQDVPTGRKIGDGTHTFFDTISPAITISNSEIGAGALSIETSIFTKMCTNMATMGASLRKLHSGSRADVSDEVYELLSDQTRHQSDKAVWMQTRDLVRAAFDEAKFKAAAKQLGEAAADPIQADVIEVVQRARKRFAWTEGEQASVLTHLIKGGDLTRYGLHAAVTRSAEDLADYDRATEFEKLGGQIIELKPNEWRELAAAA